MLTVNGYIKKVFSSIRSTGIIAIQLVPGDELKWVRQCTNSDLVAMASQNGMVILSSCENIRALGRNTRGGVAMRLKEGDKMASVDIIPASLRKDMERSTEHNESKFAKEMKKRAISKFIHISCQLNQSRFLSSAAEINDSLYSDIPNSRRDKSERKPYPTPMKELIQRAKQERDIRKAQPCRILEKPPENGLLVPQLITVAHQVYNAHASLLSGLLKLVKAIPVQRCRFCTEVHIGHVGHEIRTCIGPGSGSRSATHVWRKGGVHDVVFFPKSFHLYDRVGKPRVGHDERRKVPRIPAIVELCIQAGVDLEKHPTRRRTRPVYSIEGRIVDFEQAMGGDEMPMMLHSSNDEPHVSVLRNESDEAMNKLKLEQNTDCLNKVPTGLRDLGIMTMDSWFKMIAGASQIMDKYSVLTCGYCPEVQVGPKGHKIRMCKATKHQSRDGQHAWQEATINDLVGFNFVWHVRDPNGPPLDNKLRRYYGKAPAVVELCVQAGAPVPDQYRSMMRLDVVPPDRDEVDLVA